MDTRTEAEPGLPPGLTIEPLVLPADFEAGAVIMAASDPWRRLGIGLEHCRRVLGQAEREPWGAWLGGQLVGFALLSFKGPFVGYVQLLGVAADRRGQHIGAALLAHAEACIFARTPNVFICVSSFNEGAQRFYARHGYRTVGRLENYVVEEHDELLLRKTLGPLLGTRVESPGQRP